MKALQAVRGMNDRYGETSLRQEMLERMMVTLAEHYGYEPVRTPLLESTALFKRSIGEVTDIVEKEMYTFDDRNGDSLTLRPEGTASCVRAGIEHGLFHRGQPRWWYLGPIYRHERPQKGRYREFYQFGIEAFGLPGPDIDVEQLLLSARMWKELGIAKHTQLQLNSLGTSACRKRYREALVAYFSTHKASLDEDSVRRLETNPLRILDSKNPDMQALIAGAPSLLDHIDDESKQHFEAVCSLLETAGVDFVINPRLVRGLDYYDKTVFEWVTDCLGAQGTICAGGRYDTLVEQLGGKPTPGIGFALGIERVMALYDMEHGENQKNHIDFYVVNTSNDTSAQLILAEALRDAFPNKNVLAHCGGGSFKSQFKKADKSGATLAFVLGDDEIAQNNVGIKFLREDREQQTVSRDELIEYIEGLNA